MIRQHFRRGRLSNPLGLALGAALFPAIVTFAGGLGVVDFCVMWFAAQALAGAPLLAWHHRSRLRLSRWRHP